MKTGLSAIASLLWPLLIVSIISCKDDVSNLYPFNVDTASESDTIKPSDSSSDTGIDTNTGEPQNSDSGTFPDSATTDSTDTSSDTGADSAQDSATDMGTDSSSDSTSDSETGSASDSDTGIAPEELLIHAECAFDLSTCGIENYTVDCSNVEGKTSSSSVEQRDCWGNTCPALSSDCQVGYTDKDAWIAFADINLTPYSKITVHYSSAEDAAGEIQTGFTLNLDAVDGELGAVIITNYSGDWTTYQDETTDLTAAATGTHTIYLVAQKEGINNGNIDWIKLHN
ncbi:MAG: carbohydrate-binding protein [Deltaproteobacteria bacterium]|nr:carbohydrate-binding protein [Deltaproteobacteria bacterium]